MRNRLIEEAVALPIDKRVQLVDALIRSLNPSLDKTVDKLWVKEAEKRLAELLSGQVKAIPVEEVFNAIFRRLKK